jgi:hypothetical protein
LCHLAQAHPLNQSTSPLGNGGVAQNGGWFLGLNYARMARLRPVTGYKGAWDWTEREAHPKNDGLFRVDIQTGKKQFLVSFHQMANELKALGRDVKTAICSSTIRSQIARGPGFLFRESWLERTEKEKNQPPLHYDRQR